MLPTAEQARANAETNERLIRSEIARYGDALLPGTAEQLIPFLNPVRVGVLSPARAAVEIAKAVSAPGNVARFSNPEHVPAKLANGAAPSSLRAVLTRYADL